MKELPDEKTMLEMLELIKECEQGAREIFEMSSAIALKYQRRIREMKDAQQAQANMTE
ncbi:MAG: hypothetical protein ACRDEA_08115 [Microcystaceae cyanobacterium]